MAEWFANDDGGNYCSECGFFHDDFLDPEMPNPCPKCGAQMDGFKGTFVDRDYRLSRSGDAFYCEENEYPAWLLELRRSYIKQTGGDR